MPELLCFANTSAPLHEVRFLTTAKLSGMQLVLYDPPSELVQAGRFCWFKQEAAVIHFGTLLKRDTHWPLLVEFDLHGTPFSVVKTLAEPRS